MLDSLRHAGRTISRGLGRVMPLPRNVDTGNAEATYKNGVLTISLPKLSGGEKGSTIPVA